MQGTTLLTHTVPKRRLFVFGFGLQRARGGGLREVLLGQEAGRGRTRRQYRASHRLIAHVTAHVTRGTRVHCESQGVRHRVCQARVQMALISPHLRLFAENNGSSSSGSPSSWHCAVSARRNQTDGTAFLVHFPRAVRVMRFDLAV